jgi:hypothetical protein
MANNPNARPAPRPTAAHRSAQFWANPPMRTAQTDRVNGGDRSPHARRVDVVAVPVPSAQMRAAMAGRPVKPLPTRAVRKTKARIRRTQRRLTRAAAVAFVVLVLALLVLVTSPVAPLAVIPAALGVSAASGVVVLAWSK